MTRERCKLKLPNGKKLNCYKLDGNGQCKCEECGHVHWTCFCYEYKGKVYCSQCINKLRGNENNGNAE